MKNLSISTFVLLIMSLTSTVFAIQETGNHYFCKSTIEFRQSGHNIQGYGVQNMMGITDGKLNIIGLNNEPLSDYNNNSWQVFSYEQSAIKLSVVNAYKFDNLLICVYSSDKFKNLRIDLSNNIRDFTKCKIRSTKTAKGLNFYADCPK